MENTLLVGLSRKATLARQMDVIPNNVATANTNGFKPHRSLFEEFLTSRAHEDNFVGRDRLDGAGIMCGEAGALPSQGGGTRPPALP